MNLLNPSLFLVLFLIASSFLMTITEAKGNNVLPEPKPLNRNVNSFKRTDAKSAWLPGFGSRDTYKLTDGSKWIHIRKDNRWYFYDKANTKKTFEYFPKEDKFSATPITSWKSTRLAARKHPMLTALGATAGVGLALRAVDE